MKSIARIFIVLISLNAISCSKESVSENEQLFIEVAAEGDTTGDKDGRD